VRFGAEYPPYLSTRYVYAACAARAKVQRRLKCDTRARCHLYTEGPQAEEEKLAKDTSTTSKEQTGKNK